LKRGRGLGLSLAWRKTCAVRARQRRLGRESISSLPHDKVGYLKEEKEMERRREDFDGGHDKVCRVIECLE
jgi:hypothetical protein